MSMTIGFLAALVSVVGWGSYFVPMKKVKEYDPFFYQLLMCAVIFLSTALFSFAINSFEFSYYGVMAGISWSFGNILSVLSIRLSGLSKAAPTWMGGVIIGSFFIGAFLFSEPLSSLPLGLAGIVFLVSGVAVISSVLESKTSSKMEELKGISLALLAGLLYALPFALFKISGFDSLDFVFPMSLGIFLGGVLIYLVKRSPFDRNILVPGTVSGALWNVANLSNFFALSFLPVAIVVPLTQIALLVSVLWGVFYFHEISGRDKIRKLFFGAMVLFVGTIALSLSL